MRLSITCIDCKRIFQDFDELNNHYDECHAFQEYVCAHCPEVLFNFEMYEAHLKQTHKIEKPVNCPGGRYKILKDISKTPRNERESNIANLKFFHNYACSSEHQPTPSGSSLSSGRPRAAYPRNSNSILKSSFERAKSADKSVSPSSNDLQMDLDPFMDIKENEDIDSGSKSENENRNRISVQTDNKSPILDSDLEEAQPMNMGSNDVMYEGDEDENVLYIPETKVEENYNPVGNDDVLVQPYNENSNDMNEDIKEELYIPKVKLEEPCYPVENNEMHVKASNKNGTDLYEDDEEESYIPKIKIKEKHYPGEGEKGESPLILPVSDEIEWEDSQMIEETSFPCQVCGKMFSNERIRNRHRRVYHVPADKPYECKFCEKAFATHSNRKDHERTHTGERPYECPVCDRSFIQISNMKKHILTHKDLTKLQQCIALLGKNKKFAKVKESPLILHQRSPATLRKFKCNICDSAYNYASLLKRHMRIHTGEQPYQCPECQMPFRELVSLDYHRKKIHTEERHKCIICGQGFILSSALKKHHRVHFKVLKKKKSSAKNKKKSSVKNLEYDVSVPRVVANPPVVNVLTNKATGLIVTVGKYPTTARKSSTSNVVIITNDNPTAAGKNMTEIRESRLPITCIDCERIFQDYDQLRQHYDVTHAIQGCVHCPEIFDNFELYESHLKHQHDIEMPMNYPGGRWKIRDDISKAIRDERELSIANLKFFYNYASLKQAPTVCQRAPTVCQRAPTVCQRAPTVCQRAPTVCQRAPTVRQRVPTVRQRVPTVRQQAPTLRQQAPTVRQRVPTVRQRAPTVRQQAPTLRQRVPTVRQRAPTVRQRAPSCSTPRLSTRIAIQKQIHVEKNAKQKEQKELELERYRQGRLRKAIKAKLAMEEKKKIEKSLHKIMLEAITRKYSFRVKKSKPSRYLT